MQIFYSDRQLLHRPASEINRGKIVPPYECPVRAEQALAGIISGNFGPVSPPRGFGAERLRTIHTGHYLDFLEGAYDAWLAAGRAGDAVPLCWPMRGARMHGPPEALDARLSYYSFDISTVITRGTWDAVRAAADVAMSAAAAVGQGDSLALALCRPPGHHAGSDFGGGYCFLNNAALAAQLLRDEGARRVTILDVDYHHGNGTQEIFYAREDVQYVSLHANPVTDFPYFTGHADERGEGTGSGANLNLPLPRGTAWAQYSQALEHALTAVQAFAPDALVLSLGVDSHADDPLSHFQLATDDFRRMGEAIARLALPTAIVFEGGYAIDLIGANLAAACEGMGAT